MKRPSIIGGVIAAFCLAFIAVVLLQVDALFFPYAYYYSLKTSIASITLAYLIYLLWAKKSSHGRILLLFSVCLILGMGYLVLSLTPFILLSMFIIWLSRSLLWHRSFIAAGADGVLCGLGSIFSTFSWLHTGSLFIAIWCFFLLQALFVLIPQRFGLECFGLDTSNESESSKQMQYSEEFTRAHKSAENAIGQMMQRS